MKNCKTCGKRLPTSHFYKHPKMADGRLNFCKKCVCERIRLDRILNPEKHSERDRKRFQKAERKKQISDSQRKRRNEHPEKNRAYNAVARALRTGKISRSPCEVCGEKTVQAHHDDYSKPLKIRWLCFRCHRTHAHGQVVVSAFKSRKKTPSLVDPPETV